MELDREGVGHVRFIVLVMPEDSLIGNVSHEQLRLADGIVVVDFHIDRHDGGCFLCTRPRGSLRRGLVGGMLRHGLVMLNHVGGELRHGIVPLSHVGGELRHGLVLLSHVGGELRHGLHQCGVLIVRHGLPRAEAFTRERK
jgi:hypothetical protein